MPYFNDLNQAATWLSDMDFSLGAPFIQDGRALYDYTLSRYSDTFKSTISVPEGAPAPTVTDVVAALVDDAIAIEPMDIDKFAERMGLTKPSEAIAAWENCKASAAFLRNDLNCSYGELDSMQRFFSEHSIAAVRDATESLKAERQAAYDAAYPEPPAGFITIASLQEELDLGDYGDQCADYAGAYISDAFQDLADANVDIYNYDLLKWISNHYEWLEEADEQGLLDGIKGDLFKMIQMAQYECFTQDLYDHQEDIVKYVTLESLKDAGVYAVSQELADALETDVDYAGASTFEEALDAAKEQVHNVMAANLEVALGDEALAQNAVDELVADDDYSVVNPAALSVGALHTVNEKGYDAAFVACGFWKEYLAQSGRFDGASPSLSEAAKECRAAATGLSHDDQSQVRDADTR